MKRALLYITIFFLFCGTIWWLSGAIDHVMINWYVVDIKNELNEVFEANDTLYIDGTMLSIYLYDSMETFEINEQRYDYFEGDNQYNAIKKNIYKVERVAGEGYLKIQEDYSHPIIKLNAIINMDRVLMWRKLLTNAVIIIFGVILWLFYERKHSFKIGNKTFSEIPV